MTALPTISPDTHDDVDPQTGADEAAAETSVSPSDTLESPSRAQALDPFDQVWRRLLKEGVSLEVAETVVQQARWSLGSQLTSSANGPWLATAKAIVDLLKVTGPLKVRRDRCTILTLVGPTGVGKSTTLAKLAAIAALKERRTVAIITTDTYRVAATEQVKVYGRLLRVPVVVARSADELSEALDRHRFRDLLLVDTAGQSPNDAKRLLGLGQMMDVDAELRRYLVISATTKTSDARDVISRFGRLGVDGLLFTKLDESRTHGVILDAALSSELPISYFGIGQAVPQDIEVASVARVASLLLPLAQR